MTIESDRALGAELMKHQAFHTGHGDNGATTRLGKGERLSKSAPAIETVGTIDEASAAIGMARALCQSAESGAILKTIQHHLVRLMAHVAATPETRASYPGLEASDVAQLEAWIETLAEGIPPLKEFVLPGETVAGAALHVARTVVRRAERRLVALAREEPGLGASNLAYLNRLSSLLFVAALHEDLLGGESIELATGEHLNP